MSKQFLKNSNFSLFFKINIAFTIAIFTLFLSYNENYSALSFTLTLFGAISSAVILYIVFYIVLFLFTFTEKFIFYIATTLFVVTNLSLMVDFFIFRLYKFHINAMVLNILTSPDALDSIQLGVAPIVFVVFLVVGFISLEIYLIKKLFQAHEAYKLKLNRQINRVITIPLLFIILSEKVSYGLLSLFSKNELISNFKVIPLYQPLTFNRMAYKYFNYKPEVQTQNIIKTKAKLNYPLHPIEIQKESKKINIFIFASDAVRNGILNKETAPNIEQFKKESLVFNNHRSGGNATRFGIFSLMYGVNSTYWFSFLNANQGSVLFDVLQDLNYHIDIISSTNTNWPEFRKTCYVNVQDSIKDDFKGSPWEKDRESSQYFLNQVEKYEKDKPIFSFIFLDSPHGYSFPPEFNKFHAKNEDINYLTVKQGDKDIKSILAGYKNAVYYNDKLFGEMIAKLKEKNLYDDALIIFTSDHGQEFYEYGYFGHNSAFSNAQINAPLIIKLPKDMKVDLPLNYSNLLTSHNDVVPTLLTLLGVKNSSSDYSNGYNLFSKDFHREYTFTSNWNNNAIVTDKHSYIFSNLPNKMFKNEIRDNSSYKKIKDTQVESKIILDVMNDNRRFLR